MERETQEKKAQPRKAFVTLILLAGRASYATKNLQIKVKPLLVKVLIENSSAEMDPIGSIPLTESSTFI